MPITRPPKRNTGAAQPLSDVERERLGEAFIDGAAAGAKAVAVPAKAEREPMKPRMYRMGDTLAQRVEQATVRNGQTVSGWVRMILLKAVAADEAAAKREAATE